MIDSIDSEDRLKDCKRELDNLLQEERLSGASLLILANKQDIPKALSVQEITERLLLDDIKTHHYRVLPSSAVEGTNLMERLEWIVDDIASRVFILD